MSHAPCPPFWHHLLVQIFKLITINHEQPDTIPEP